MSRLCNSIAINVSYNRVYEIIGLKYVRNYEFSLNLYFVY